MKEKTKEELLKEIKLLQKRITELELENSMRKEVAKEAHKLALIAHQSKELINLATLDGRMVFLNEAGQQMLGIDPAEVTNRMIIDVIPQRFIEIVQRDLLPQTIDGHGWKGELQYKNLKTGEIKDVYAVTFIIPNTETGMPMYLANVSLDITDRKQMEEALRRSEEKYRSVVETSLEAVWFLDKEFKTTEINPAASHILGYSKEELIGRPFTDLLFEEDRPAQVQEFERRRGGVSAQYDRRIRCKDGSEKWLFISAKPILDAVGQFIGSFGLITDITERKLNEEKIKNLLLRHEAILSAVPDIIMEVDNKKVYAWANKAGFDFFGDDVIGKEASYYFEGEQKTYDLVQPVFNGYENVIYLESWQRRKDGKKRLLAWWCKTLKDNTGRIIGSVSSAQDITEHRQAERELSEIKDMQYRAILKNLPQKVFFKDVNSVYISCNENYARDFGIKPEEIRGKTDYDLYEKELADKHIEYDKKIIMSGKAEEVEEQYAEGEKEMFVHKLKAPIMDEKNNIVGLFGIFWDITQRKEVERELIESEEKFRTIFDSAKDGIILVDVETKKIYMGNKAFCKMFGYTSEEIQRLTILDIHPKKDLGNVLNQFERLVREEFNIAQDIPAKRQDGSVFFVDITSSWIKISGKEYIMGLFHDITERRKIEEQRKHFDEIKISAETRLKFASDVSHELRTPIATIKGCIKLVMNGSTGAINDKQMDFLDTADRNADRLARLINNVLDYQKMDLGKMEFHIEKNDISNVLKEACEGMDILAKEKKLDFTLNIEKDLPKVSFDKDKIIQVVTNLVSNAIKFTDKGGVSINVGLKNNVLHVIVQDTGFGIKTEDIPKLFQAFEQLDRPRDKKKGGTGLGLAISREIILGHNGKIWVESEFGKGSRFHFTLPV